LLDIKIGLQKHKTTLNSLSVKNTKRLSRDETTKSPCSLSDGAELDDTDKLDNKDEPNGGSEARAYSEDFKLKKFAVYRRIPCLWIS